MTWRFNVETAVAQVALLEAGAVGLGAWVVTVLASSAADLTGLLAAGTLAIVGFFVIPYKRTQAKGRFRGQGDGLAGQAYGIAARSILPRGGRDRCANEGRNASLFPVRSVGTGSHGYSAIRARES